ncbi:hypothetical protein [Inhella sp.]|uniref:hypothetical protein n=1 Tax=Inhella sp. TaxID=1921806 RepID=UPI0035AEEC24
MLRTLITALTLLHLGPGLAFALLAFGCGDGAAWLGSLCSGPELRSFAWLTLGAWAILVPVASWWQWRVARSKARRGDGWKPSQAAGSDAECAPNAWTGTPGAHPVGSAPMPSAPLSPRRRALIFLATLAAGLSVGVVGHHFSGDQAWFLALPVAVAGVWWFVGTPQDCDRC